MPRYIAFLRAVNVGGRVVKMDALRSIFEEAGLENVSTYIASGNVIFETGSGGSERLERLIEDRLRDRLGFDVATMVRTDGEVASVAAYEPFDRRSIEAARRLHVGFMSRPLTEAALTVLGGMENEIDRFHVKGREIYWLCATGISESRFTNVRFEKACGTLVTFRNVNTVRKLAALYPPE